MALSLEQYQILSAISVYLPDIPLDDWEDARTYVGDNAKEFKEATGFSDLEVMLTMIAHDVPYFQD